MPEPYVSALAAALAAAALQALLARWRDLAPASVALGAAALVLADRGDPRTWGGLAIVAALVAVGQWRSSRRGLARPELLATTAAVGVALVALAEVLPRHPGLHEGLAAASALVGLAATGVSIARLGARRVAVRWTGEIPVSGPPSPAPSPAPVAPPPK